MKNRIAEVRKEKGLTQKELAQRLGITPQGVSFIENSENVKLSTLKKIADALGCSGFLELLIPRDFEGKYRIVYENDYIHLLDDEESSEQEEQAQKDEKYINKLAVPALKLNDIGRKILLDNAESMTKNEDLTK